MPRAPAVAVFNRRSDDGSRIGHGRSTIASTRLNTLDVAPMPSPSDNTATATSAGARMIRRMA